MKKPEKKMSDFFDTAKTLTLFLSELQAQPPAWKTELQKRLFNKNPELFRKKTYEEMLAHLRKNSMDNNVILSSFSLISCYFRCISFESG